MGPIRLMRLLKQEFAPAQNRHRRPEPDLIMDKTEQVAAYTEGGSGNGSLTPLYRLHLEKLYGIIRTGDVILDLGCGSGQLTSLMAKIFPDSHFVGVDLSAEMLKVARQICEKNLLKNVEFVMDDIVSLSKVGARTFDVVLSCLAFHHLPDREHLLKACSSINRIIKDDGGILISDLGPIRSERSIELLVEDQRGQQSPLLCEDYEHSLRAAFMLEDWRLAMKQLNRVQVEMQWTQPINFFLQVHSHLGRRSIRTHRPQSLPSLSLRHQFEYFLLSSMLGRR